MAHRNRWFTELKNGGSFHGELLVIIRWFHVVSRLKSVPVFLGGEKQENRKAHEVAFLAAKLHQLWVVGELFRPSRYTKIMVDICKILEYLQI